ncbi:calcium release-activated calcium channel protein 1 isoform X2 [Eurytemora carolleeae]|uniref:calcium release-activated calcium channel protein 1 isoform X2 n=1 Tax=Eurytemora carolleeae TaxID=1294199 RepID=UPI000C78D2BC|nr:calcium release-activated calcium channel protein 1 isoform X2 [Eurytemora carolleeae]XP_023328552.1 calcium release-activated calcium channel protein 1 isoform X2 [Eurytemora carolleeae]|eukprot:XP_023328551.1 calcium release-activated calcium channel protein 1-like isoform X2 [Eurytemora affinis]
MSKFGGRRDFDPESYKGSEQGYRDDNSFHSINRQSSVVSNYTAFSKPTLSPQNSLLFPRTPIVVETGLNRTRMGTMGVDESIFHWKILNLSRAKLKASSRTSALLSGFAMVAMVEIQIDETIPRGLLIAFAVCTVLLIAVHMLALMISTCILPNVEAVSNLHVQTPNTVFESPHRKMSKIIELSWGFSTVLGILLFLVEIAILCWVKFYKFDVVVAWVATALLIPIIFIFIAFAAHFYLKLVSHKSEVYEHNMKELELLKDQLDEIFNVPQISVLPWVQKKMIIV